MDSKVYKLRAFTKALDGGNRAGVVLNAEKIDNDAMLEIARAIGYSETAFVSASKRADYRVQFFSPAQEVDLCGHATIATWSLLRDRGLVSTGVYTQETKAGILKIRVYEHEIFMEQNTPVFGDKIALKEINACFHSSDITSIENRPIQIVSTGLKDILLPIKSIKELNELLPNFEQITDLSRKHDVVGIHAFSENQRNCEVETARCRNFAPLYGINEEAATGTSNGALACYLQTYSQRSESNSTCNHIHSKYTFAQGHTLNQPSEIKVELETLNTLVVGVYVGGSALEI